MQHQVSSWRRRAVLIVLTQDNPSGSACGRWRSLRLLLPGLWSEIQPAGGGGPEVGAGGGATEQTLMIYFRLEGQKMAPKSQQIVFQNSLEILEYPN